MVDVDPGLDTKLRAFFEHIEASTPPSALADITTSTPTRRRRTINVVAGLAAVAVVAASITLFAVELGTHRGPAKSSLPASAAQLKRMPLLGNGGIPKSAHVLIPLTRGHGSARLKTFVPAGDAAHPVSIATVSRQHGRALLDILWRHDADGRGQQFLQRKAVSIEC